MIDRCPECGSSKLIENYSRGEVCCEECNSVVNDGMIDYRPKGDKSEWCKSPHDRNLNSIQDEIDPILKKYPILQKNMSIIMGYAKYGINYKGSVSRDIQCRNILAEAFCMVSVIPIASEFISFKDKDAILRILDTHQSNDSDGNSIRGRARVLPQTLNWSRSRLVGDIRRSGLPEDCEKIRVMKRLEQLSMLFYYGQFHSLFQKEQRGHRPATDGFPRKWTARGSEIAYLACLQAAAILLNNEIEITPEGEINALGLKGGKPPFPKRCLSDKREFCRLMGVGEGTRHTFDEYSNFLGDQESADLCKPPYELIGRFQRKNFHIPAYMLQARGRKVA